MKKVRLGVIGAGVIGTMHMKNIMGGKTPVIELIAVADEIQVSLDRVKENFPDVLRYSNAETMMDSGKIDAVLIATPHYNHTKSAIAAFKRKLHVMTEKPAGVYTKEVREMNEAAERSGVVFGIMYQQRTEGLYIKMRELVKGGTLGAIRRVNWIVTDWYRPQAYYDSGKWRATWAGEGGGGLINQCPHNLDLWQWICGMPVSINAFAHFGKWHNIEVEDDVTAYVEYANGATGVFITSTGDVPGTNRFEITLEKGKLVAENGLLKLWELDVSEPEFSRTNTDMFGTPKVTESIINTDKESNHHSEVLNSFAGAILHGAPLIAEGVEGINGLMLSNAMHLSAWLDKKINLPIDEDLFYRELMKRVNS